MVRTSTKSAKQTTPVVSAAAPVQQETVAVASAPVVAEQKKAKKAKEPKAVVEVAAVVSEPVVANTVVSVAPVSESVESPITVKMAEFSAKFQQLSSLFSSFKTEYKALERTMQKELRAAQKSSSKKAKRSGNRQPSGFVKPTRISDELALFLGKETGVEMARTTVSKEINQYIRTNSLQDKTNGRKIIPDAKLATLLKTQATDELTYFNLQKFMKHHFIKESVSVAAPSTA
jgi:chromatin remodeling complex protein RSC6